MSEEKPLATYYRWLEFKIDGKVKGYTVFVQFPQAASNWKARDAEVSTAVRDLANLFFKEKNISAEFLSEHRLPYPAAPYIGNSNGWPAFCFDPTNCKGHSSCPRSYSCSE